jgi:hypothetical protein
MATTIKQSIGTWDTLHENGPFPTKNLFITSLESEGNLPSVTDRYNDAAVEVQRLLREALSLGEGFRAIGSRWSMNNIAHQKDNLHVNAKMNLKKTIAADEMEPGSSFKSDHLFFFQCGNTIKEMHNFLAAKGRSLHTSGASNGQTIAGCISTGVHGSALDTGSVQDCVVSLNLLIGPDPQDNIFLERESQPGMNERFVQSIHARLIRNDELFNAALVGLGSFGFIHGVVIETEDRFLLKRYVRKINKEIALQLATTLNFGDSVFKILGETDADGHGLLPYHYKVFINPYVNDAEYVVEAMYKKPYQQGYPDPLPVIKTSIYRDLIHLFIRIAESCQNNIPKLIKLLEKSILPPPDLEATGTLGEIFWDAGYQGPAYACSVGVNHRDSRRALDLMVKLAKEEGPIPGIYAMRFVKQSKATLAFTKFPVTCMLEIDGITWTPHNNNMISLQRFSTRMIELLKANNIPFTLHWGKNADWSFPGLVDHMYGPSATAWKQQRSSLLNREQAALFSNDFLVSTKLDEYMETVTA